jgi:phosphocarrier protein FPr
MFVMERKLVRLNAHPHSKEDAIREVAGLLIEAGHIPPEYVESMLGREQQANTFLGNGIAIPHGMLKDKEAIRSTGIAVLQVPQGVDWNAGEKARLVVGIAARSDEHIEVLAALTDVLGDPATVDFLATTDNPDEIIRRLSPNGAAAAAPSIDLVGSQIQVQLVPGAGLHARPATELTKVATAFQSNIQVAYNGKVADAKSMISLLKLGAPGAAMLTLAVDGPDADQAIEAVRRAIESGLGEGEHDEHTVVATSSGWQPAPDTPSIAGIAASPGLAIGPIHIYATAQLQILDNAKDPAAEERSLQEAVAGARAQLNELYTDVKERSGEAKAAIFQAHMQFLDDPELTGDALGRIRTGHSASWSWNEAINARSKELRATGNELLANRAVDLQDVGQRVLRLLGGVSDTGPSLPDTPVILVAEDLTPSDTASLDPQRILGFCTASGGPTSHTAIIARSLDIPSICGAGPAVLKLANGRSAILDGFSGTLYLDVAEADVRSARAAQQDLAAQREAERLACYEPAITVDGHRVEVVANVSGAAEAAKAVEAGGEGIGLFRTEFLYLERDTAPSEDEQYAAYHEVASALNGLPAIIRTLDIGGDKNVPYLNLPHEDNAFLGLRGIRLCLARPDLFRKQLRAIFRATSSGPLRIMYPMIATIEDVRAAKRITEEVRKELDAPPVEIGIMVEVPSTAVIARELAREVDFFSVGTNDLTQYALAMDRLHPVLSRQADGLHPAVLRLIDMTVRAAEAEGKWVGVCGGIAGERRGALILTGMGVKELSVAIPSIAAIKAAIRKAKMSDLQELARQALACATAPQVRALPLP